MSAKNALQESCQRNQWELPRYITEQVKGTPPHEPLFISIVEFNGHPYKGSPCKTKTLAEKSAAEAALGEGAKNQSADRTGRRAPYGARSPEGNASLTPYRERAPSEFSRVCLVDLENLPQASSHAFPRDCYVIGFVGKTHHYASGAQRAVVELQLDLRVIDSAVKDSADHLLSFEAGRLCAQLLSAGRFVKFAVFSRDHAAEATVVAIRSLGFVAEHHVDISTFT